MYRSEVFKMSDEENVNIHFVVPKGLKSENLCSDDMKMAFQVRILPVLRILLLCSKRIVLLFGLLTSRLPVPMSFQSCVEHELSPKWVLERNCASLKTSKQDVFVFQQFEGDKFSQYRSRKCV